MDEEPCNRVSSSWYISLPWCKMYHYMYWLFLKRTIMGTSATFLSIQSKPNELICSKNAAKGIIYIIHPPYTPSSPISPPYNPSHPIPSIQTFTPINHSSPPKHQPPQHPRHNHQRNNHHKHRNHLLHHIPRILSIPVTPSHVPSHSPTHLLICIHMRTVVVL